jgi:hypothetical protein
VKLSNWTCDRRDFRYNEDNFLNSSVLNFAPKCYISKGVNKIINSGVSSYYSKTIMKKLSTNGKIYFLISRVGLEEAMDKLELIATYKNYA